MKNYKQFNESIRDLLVGPSEEEALKSNPTKVLIQAIEENDLELSKSAIEYGADVNYSGYENILHKACFRSYELVKLLLDNGIDYDFYSLYITYLFSIDYPNNKSYFKIYELLSEHYDKEIDLELLLHPDQYLELSVHTNDLINVKRAITLGADVNKDISLFYCLIRHQNKIAEYLLKKGAKCNDKDIKKCIEFKNLEIIPILKEYIK